MSISELIERLESATGPNYALEIDIFKYLHPEYADYVQGRGGLIHPCDGEDVRVQSNVRPPNYTASLDAAMDLLAKVLPDAELLIGFKQTALTKPWARVGKWSSSDATGPNLALALCTAIFKAKQAQEAA